MSADNWALCPRCKWQSELEYRNRAQEVRDSYGKVAPEYYLETLKALETKPDLEPTFREDYELGVLDNGQFYVNYRGGCTQCGLNKEFKHDETLTGL